MEEKREWKYCVAGNIRKIHFDDEGIIWYGTLAFTGGTKVFLCGKCWNFTQKVYRPSILELMNNFEFRDYWRHNTKSDKREAEEFAEKWNALFEGKEYALYKNGSLNPI